MKFLREEKGTALFLTILLIALVGSIATAMIIGVNINIKMTGNIAQNKQAFYAAEAGIDYGKYKLDDLMKTQGKISEDLFNNTFTEYLSNNSSYFNLNFIDGAPGGFPTQSGYQYITLVSEGYFLNSTEKIQTVFTIIPSVSKFNYSVASNGDLRILGDSKIANGDLVSNGTFIYNSDALYLGTIINLLIDMLNAKEPGNIKEGKLRLDNSLISAQNYNISDSSKIVDKNNKPFPDDGYKRDYQEIEFPSIDWNRLNIIASNQGNVYDYQWYFRKQLKIEPENVSAQEIPVTWVKGEEFLIPSIGTYNYSILGIGDLTINGHGIVVLDGNVFVGGKLRLKPDHGKKLIVLVNGDLTVLGKSSQFDGVLYTAGDVLIAGKINKGTGSIISKGSTDLWGDITFVKEYLESPEMETALSHRGGVQLVSWEEINN